MIDKRLRNQITQLKLIISVAEHLHFYSTINSFVESGSKSSLGCLGGNL